MTTRKPRASRAKIKQQAPEAPAEEQAQAPEAPAEEQAQAPEAPAEEQAQAPAEEQAQAPEAPAEEVLAAAVAAASTARAEEEEAPADDFAPTPAELAEAAALGDAARAGQAAPPAPPAPPERPLQWFAVGRDADLEVVGSDRPYDTPKNARVSIHLNLDGEGIRHVSRICAFQVRDVDEAVALYRALPVEGGRTVLPDPAEVWAAGQQAPAPGSRSRSGGARRAPAVPTTTPVRPGLSGVYQTRTVPVEQEEYYVGKSGTMHADRDCRFVRNKPVSVLASPERDAARRAMAGELLTAADGARARTWCVFCCATTATVAVAADGGAAAVVEAPDDASSITEAAAEQAAGAEDAQVLSEEEAALREELAQADAEPEGDGEDAEVGADV